MFATETLGPREGFQSMLDGWRVGKEGWVDEWAARRLGVEG